MNLTDAELLYLSHYFDSQSDLPVILTEVNQKLRAYFTPAVTEATPAPVEVVDAPVAPVGIVESIINTVVDAFTPADTTNPQ